MDDDQSTAAIPNDYLDMEHSRMNEKFSSENQVVKDLYDSMLSTGKNDGRYAENTFVDRLVKLTKTPWGLAKRHRVIDAKEAKNNNNNNSKKKSLLVNMPKQTDVSIRSKRDVDQQGDVDESQYTDTDSDREDSQTEQNCKNMFFINITFVIKFRLGFSQKK